MENKIVMLSVDKLYPHPDNPRKDLGDLSELAESIKSNGILQNLTVVPGEDAEHYMVIIGHRRMAAAKKAGLTEVPCAVVNMSHKEQVATMLVENVQRSDLTAYEQAMGFQMMLDLGETQQSIAKQTGFSEATVSRRIRLMKLDAKKLKAAESRGGTMEQYIKVAEIKTASDRKRALDAIGTDGFNRTMQQILKEQAIKENTPKIIKEVSAFAKKADSGVTCWSDGYRRVKDVYIDKWKPGDLVIKTKNDTEYVYVIQYGLAYILEKLPKQAKEGNKLSEKEKAARKRRRELGAITKEMYELRRDFMMEYSAGIKNKDILTEWLMATIVGSAAGKLYKFGSLNKGVLQKKIGQDSKRTYDIDKELLRSFYERDPGAAMALIAYSNSGDREDSGYYYPSYSEGMPYYQKNEDLDVLYDFLCRIGYTMCEEEKQLQAGTHPLFKK
ncbi:MAG: ParB/RepB/Spo0J family partition protein [Clostridia bacterium]|nr:ParB/RepB/Spo0J family partition protein [Clostridia bacterium]